MMWDWHDSGWWWFLMLAGMLMFWALVIWLLVQLARGDRSRGTSTAADPEAIVASRYARGEIDANEYEARMAVLRRGTEQAA